MEETRFMYKGAEVVVKEDHPRATITVNKREFKATHHHPPVGLSMWMCDEAYFMSPDLTELARHFVDYGYMFDSPGRIVVPGGHDASGHGGNPGHVASKPRSRKTGTGG